MRDFLGLKDTGNEFPHENKGKDTTSFVAKLWANQNKEYDAKVEQEVIAWMKTNGFECKKIKNEE